MNRKGLILRCRAGDTRAFNELYTRYSKPLFNFIYRMIKNHELAEDLLQDTFLKVLTGNYQPRGKLKSWLYKVAANLCLNEIKRGRRTVRLEEDVPNPRDKPHEQVERKELSQKIEEAIFSLHPPQRIAFILRHYQGLPYEEIATVLGCPLGTVKSRIHNAVRNLRIYLEDHYEV